MDPLQQFLIEARAHLEKEIESRYGLTEHIRLEVPGERADFSLPCFSLARLAGKAPDAVASELASSYSGNRLEMRSSGGYVNINASGEQLSALTVDTILRMKDRYGLTARKEERVIVEHTSINPNGPIHVGRARNAIIGDTLVRCMKQCGYNVTSEYYVDDVGRQVIVLLWGIRNIKMEEDGEKKPDRRLVRYYIKASELAKNDARCAAEIQELQQKLDSGDRETVRAAREVADLVLSGIRESLASINVALDTYTYESDLIVSGKVRDVIERLKKLPSAIEEEGAWYIPVKTRQGEDRFYFTRKDGTSLYTTRDVAYHIDKFSRAERVIDVLGEDQKLGTRFLTAALAELDPGMKPEFLFYSFVSLPSGRMSTRAGSFVLLDDLVTEGIRRAKEEVLKRREVSDAEAERIAVAVGPGALRYNILRLQPEKKVVFRWEEALNFEGSSAPFIQYAHARACSILEKAGDWKPVELEYDDESELALCRHLALFPSVLNSIAETMAVHRIATYAQELASLFNQFYRLVTVLKAPAGRRESRLALVDATATVLKIALNCMGIEAPGSM
ncbi:MAG: arginine--tRNA ligase [Thermoplasmata archaeon]|uniref:Arginine--tRNA ligase n=1 Tax=Candidatus Sysuiplasma superficiale TaxID=2823368 RepID=A0A8J7YTC0_9ARCH|nr:arginine--tRNA ligase [Candidatus Sysuiplasma superficiale]MBX8644219.1 arginine--tRNA ligase [Candidatus Sysuiplasma superficiale]MCL4347025.1 arginine--tRNA ligase [Candidatus Thermoplasmatota archaeon]